MMKKVLVISCLMFLCAGMLLPRLVVGLELDLGLEGTGVDVMIDDIGNVAVDIDYEDMDDDEDALEPEDFDGLDSLDVMIDESGSVSVNVDQVETGEEVGDVDVKIDESGNVLVDVEGAQLTEDSEDDDLGSVDVLIEDSLGGVVVDVN